ncbi:MAG TPA: alkaline phosphatase [Chthoniobacterales bacterium]
MKSRNLLLALACIVAFVLAGVLYFKNWVVQKPFAIILFTGDGLTTSSLAATRLYNGGASGKLFVESLPEIALLKTFASDFGIPDSAAAASAIASGTPVNNRSLGIGPERKNLDSLITLAAAAGRKTGLITNGTLTEPGVAAYYAHTADATDGNAIAKQLIQRKDIDLVLGGGEKFFLPVDKGGLREDGTDLVLELKKEKWGVARTKAELAAVPVWLPGRVFGVFNRDELAFSREIESGSQEPSLEDMVRTAIQILQINPKGYFLVVDAGLIEKAGRVNDAENFLAETVVLDRVIRTAKQYAGNNTLIIAAGKQNPGGLRMNGYPLRSDSGMAVLGINARGIPSVTWSTGPNALPTPSPVVAPTPAVTPHPEILPSLTVPEPPLPDNLPLPTPPQLAARARNEPSTVFSEESLNVADDPLGFGVGPGSETLHGYKNATAIFSLIANQL